MKLKEYAGVARANFLLLPFTLVAVGAAAAAFDGDFNLLHTLLALVGLVGLHVAVNALNEVSDFRRGIDLETVRTPFSGGSGTLPSGALQPRRGSGGRGNRCPDRVGGRCLLSRGLWLENGADLPAGSRRHPRLHRLSGSPLRG